jgi:hypothetical protein
LPLPSPESLAAEARANPHLAYSESPLPPSPPSHAHVDVAAGRNGRLLTLP